MNNLAYLHCLYGRVPSLNLSLAVVFDCDHHTVRDALASALYVTTKSTL